MSKVCILYGGDKVAQCKEFVSAYEVMHLCEVLHWNISNGNMVMVVRKPYRQDIEVITPMEEVMAFGQKHKPLHELC